MHPFSKTLGVLIIIVFSFTVAPANAEQGDILLRVRTIGVLPTGNSSGITPAFPTETVDVDDSFVPELDFTYMVTNHIGVELVAAVTRHDISGRTGATGSIGELAEATLLPPTLTAQYHFLPDKSIRPYVGAGVNYTVFFNDDASEGLQAVAGPTSVNLTNSFSWVLQAGIDIDLNDKIFLNMDIKYVDMDTNARLDTTAIGTQRVGVDINPIIIGIGLGWRL